MTPTAFSFEGIKIVIYFEDHLPVHFHALYAEYETIYELILENGKLIDIQTRHTSNDPLPIVKDKMVRKFLKKHYKQVVEKWTDVIILKKNIRNTRISGIR